MILFILFFTYTVSLSEINIKSFFHKGFNCSLFAYGQTGAGKSYSMVGYGPNK